jgi:hypothetical protein
MEISSNRRPSRSTYYYYHPFDLGITNLHVKHETLSIIQLGGLIIIIIMQRLLNGI